MSLIALRFGVYGLVIFAVLWAGNHYGPNALWRTHREAEDRARNAVLTDLAERETDAGAAEDAVHTAADAEFALLSKGLEACPLTAAAAAAVNVVRE